MHRKDQQNRTDTVIIRALIKVGNSPYTCTTCIQCFGCKQEVVIDIGQGCVWNDVLKKLREFGWDQRKFHESVVVDFCNWVCMFESDAAKRVWEYWRNR
jgi:hypothetical protein